MSEIDEPGVLKYGDIVKLSADGQYLFSKGVSNSGLLWSDSPVFGDFTLGLFRILPKSLHIIENELLNSRQISLAERLETCKESLRVEILNNIHHYAKLAGTAVSIGSHIYLQHLPTNKFLAVDLSDYAKESIIFRLQDIPDENSLIRIEAVFNFQKEKMKVMNGDQLYLDIWNSTMNTNISMLKQQNKVHASFENRSRIKFIHCSKNEDLDESQIYNWNYVFIKDSENNFGLTTQENEVFFYQDFDLSSSLWRIESENPGGVLKDAPYRIKHISKKLYLHVRTVRFL